MLYICHIVRNINENSFLDLSISLPYFTHGYLLQPC